MLFRSGETSLFLLGQVLGTGMDGYRSFGSRRGSRQVQIACAISLAESSGLIAIIAQGNPGIAGDVHLFGRLALELHAAVCAFDGFTIPMDTDFQMILEFDGNIAIAMVVLLDFRQDIGLAAVPTIAVTAAGYLRRIAEDADGFTHLLGDGGIRGFSLTASRDGKGTRADCIPDGVADFLQLDRKSVV